MEKFSLTVTTKVLAFAESFQGINSPSLEAIIFEEYVNLAKKVKLLVIAEDNYSNPNVNIKVIKVSKVSHPILLRTLIRIIVYSFETVRNRKEFDIVYTRSLGLNFLICSIIAKKLFKKKLIFFIAESRKTHTSFRARFFRTFLKKVLENSDHLITPSMNIVEEIESYLTKIDRTKVIIARENVDIKKFCPKNKLLQENVILTVSRIEPVKAIEVLINSMSLIAKEIPDVKLKIVGLISNQKYFNNLKNLISKLNCEKLIEFVGPIPHDQLPKWYNNSKIFVLTSLTEAASNVTMEAMSCGKPVIVTRVGGMPNLIEDQLNGFLVKPNNPQLVAKKVIELLKDNSLRARIGKEARNTISNEFKQSNYIDELINLFKK